MPARRRSSCSAAACDTGVTSGSVTRMILVYAGSCSRISGVTTCGRCRAFELARHLPVVGAGRVHQQQRVAGRCGVQHDEGAARLADDAREGVEHRDLLGAGRVQVLQQQRPLCRVELGRLGRHDLVDVALRLDLRVDAAHLAGPARRRPASPPDARPDRWCSGARSCRAGSARAPGRRRSSSCRRRPCPSP